MKNARLFALIAVPLAAGALFFGLRANPGGMAALFAKEPTEIKWMTLNEAIAANQKEKKGIFIDVYTNWCGWCKVMDQKTFTDPAVISYLSKQYYCVKFNAEEDEAVIFNGKEYRTVMAGQRTIHTLAYKLLGGRMAYPAYVTLDGDLQPAGTFRGYMEPAPFLQQIKTIAGTTN